MNDNKLKFHITKLKNCYEHIKINKTEQGWSSNQFAVHASKYSV